MVPENSRTINSTLILLILSGLLSSGCSSRKPKDAIPVVGPPPPRYSYENDSPSSQPIVGIDPEATRSNNGFMNVSLNEPADKLITDTRTVAYVNGEPILASEVLEPFAEKLDQLQQQLPPDQFEDLRLGLIQRDLPIHIDNRLLIQGFKSTLKKPQQDLLDDAVSKLFNEEIQKLKAQFDVHTDIQLEMKLQEKGSSLNALERAFGNRVMAAEFLRAKAGSIPEPSRRELLEAYEQRKREEYFHPARVRWQQILISFGANGGKQGALEKLTRAAQALRDRTDFSEVAKQYSDGPGAAQGGYWDWMQKGSLTDQAIEDELFSMPVGQISDVLVGESSFQLVRVLEREDEYYVPFETVQEALKDKLQEEYRNRATEQVMKELRANAVIQTMFDEPELTESEAGPAPEIAPVGFVEQEPNPFASRAETPPNPFAEREASAAREAGGPFAERSVPAARETDNPFAERAVPASRESEADGPFADEARPRIQPKNNSFESFTEQSPFE